MQMPRVLFFLNVCLDRSLYHLTQVLCTDQLKVCTDNRFVMIFKQLQSTINIFLGSQSQEAKIKLTEEEKQSWYLKVRW